MSYKLTTLRCNKHNSRFAHYTQISKPSFDQNMFLFILIVKDGVNGVVGEELEALGQKIENVWAWKLV